MNKKVSKKIFTLFVSAIAAVTMQAEVYSGSCGNKLTWLLDTSKGLLEFEGSGDMTNYESGQAPWYAYQQYVTQIVFPSGMNSIGNYAFWNCVNVAHVKIPAFVDNIGDYAFSSCAVLRTLEIRHGVKSIGKGAFGLCLALETVVIPSSVTTIDELAFMGCGNLKNVYIPASVKTLGKQAFAMCTSLQWIVNAASTPQTLLDNVFYYVDKPNCRLTIIASAEQAFRSAAEWGDFNITPVQATALGLCGDNLLWTFEAGTGSLEITGTGNMYDYYSEWEDYRAQVQHLQLQEGVSTIGEEAFLGFSALTSVTLPGSLQSVDSRPFDECFSMTAINVAAANQHYCSLDGVLLDKAKTNLIKYPTAKAGTEYTIPNTVTSITGWAFAYCPLLKSVTIPSSVTAIGKFAFAGCELQEIYNYAPPQPIFPFDMVFLGLNQANCILYVPQEYYQAYKTAEVWKDFNVQVTNRGEGIDHVNHKSEIINHKFIKDGQLLILRNGKTYNASGAEVK